MSKNIKCACGNSGCTTKIIISHSSTSLELWFTDDEGRDTLMYLDANATVELSRALVSHLSEFAKQGE